eukprot:5778414-Karenia_brevis.AAC.1
MENINIVADCGILDACGMVYKPRGQRNTNPIGSEADDAAGPSLYVVCGMESSGSLGLPAMQGVSDSVVGTVR